MLPSTIILGSSGTGKSSSIRGLPPEETIILNTEQKALPFRGSAKFKGNILVPDRKTFFEKLEKVINSKKVKYVVIESMTSAFEQFEYHNGMAFSGYDSWKGYNDDISKMWRMIKTCTDKYFFLISIDQIIDSPTGVAERYAAVQGKRWLKQIEKEAVNVLVSTTKTDASTGKIEYMFVTNKCQGYENTPSKSPPEMFPLEMPNNLKDAIYYMEIYLNGEEEDKNTLQENKKTKSN
jgi:hypothetical protein